MCIKYIKYISNKLAEVGVGKCRSHFFWYFYLVLKSFLYVFDLYLEYSVLSYIFTKFHYCDIKVLEASAGNKLNNESKQLKK